MECNFGNAMACSSQFWNQLENKRSEDNKVFREIWKAVETKAGKIRTAKTKRNEKEMKSKGAEKRRKS